MECEYWFYAVGEPKYLVWWPGNATQTQPIDFCASGFTMPKNDRLALIVHRISGLATIGVQTTGSSFITSPPRSPDYPIAELFTVALMGAGLLAVAGYLVLRRRGTSGFNVNYNTGSNQVGSPFSANGIMQ